ARQKLVGGSERPVRQVHRTQQHAQRVPDGIVVVHDVYQHGVTGAHSSSLGCCCAAAGSEIVNRVPPGGFARNVSVPSCAATIVRLIARPTPSPSFFDVTKGSNTASASFGETPEPA